MEIVVPDRFFINKIMMFHIKITLMEPMNAFIHRNTIQKKHLNEHLITIIWFSTTSETTIDTIIKALALPRLALVLFVIVVFVVIDLAWILPGCRGLCAGSADSFVYFYSSRDTALKSVGLTTIAAGTATNWISEWLLTQRCRLLFNKMV